MSFDSKEIDPLLKNPLPKRALALTVLLSIFSVSLASPFERSGRLPEALGGPADVLPVDEAFRFGFTHEPDATRLFWQVTPGYYLYRDKFRFSLDSDRVEVEMAEGMLRNDEIFGEVQVYEGYIELQLPKIPSKSALRVEYQGCAALGYCYPPQKKSITAAN